MAVGWARDGAVQEQIDVNVQDAVNLTPFGRICFI
jgi:hypothetical protein